MKKPRLLRTLILFAMAVILLLSLAAYDRWTGQLPGGLVSLLLTQIKLPPGFEIHIYAVGVPNARSLALSPDGIVFVGSRRAGRVYALLDRNHANKADEVITIARGLNNPNGVAFRDGALYVAEINRILRFDDIQAHLQDSPHPVIVNANFPSDPAHGWKFIRFSPDGWLYVPVGAPCNICEPKDARFATVMRMRPDGSDLQVFARGIRNSVGFDWHPVTNDFWFTDNGRDMLGDDIPPDELNHAPSIGMNFGFPYCHGGNIPDPQFGHEHPCSEFVPPSLDLPAHVAALGMRFYTGAMFPPAYRNQIFIAEHGSWNRSIPIGYRISLAEFADNQTLRYRVFASGWLKAGFHWGRPVDILVMPDGALLVTDDFAGAVYRISYQNAGR